MSDNPTNGTSANDPGQADDHANEIAVEVEAPSAEAQPARSGEAQGAVAEASDPLAALQAQKNALEAEKNDYWNRLLRAKADLENYRKRARRDVDDARTEARTQTLKEILPVIDNLERAVQHSAAAGGPDTIKGLIEGVQLVLRQFGQALERCGVNAVEALGKPFDPNQHEAITQVETTEHPPGSVVQVYQKGYLIGDRLLRPALVVVAKAPAGQESQTAAQSEPGAPKGNQADEA